MPHAVPKGLGLQALILCGPGSSFPTFTANPDENPKALLPIANRPMVWYPLDFCYRAGLTDITLICPPSAAAAIRTALKTNPFLTSLPAPAVVAPAGLDQTTGTATILRLTEVRAIVTADFVVLPCDLVCELGGERLVQAWMARAASLADVLASDEPAMGRTTASIGARHSGGLGVWYDTRTGLPRVKSEETDFVVTVPLNATSSTTTTTTTTTTSAHGSLLPRLERVVTAMPTDSYKDLIEVHGDYPVRHGLLRRHRRARMRTSHRDAHMYILPQWVMEFVHDNPHMDSIGEDVLGWWAKAQWQPALAPRLHLDRVLQHYGDPALSEDGTTPAAGTGGQMTPAVPAQTAVESTATATGVAPTAAAAATTAPALDLAALPTLPTQPVPPLLAYVHPSDAAPLIRRVDTSQLLLTVSLQLAKLASLAEVAAADSTATISADGTAPPATAPLATVPLTASPFAHARKVAYPEGVKMRTTITRADSLVADNVTVEEKVSIKECVIGANCQIHEGAKLHQCLLMEGVVVGKACRLTRCILGRRSEIGAGSVLANCEVQENLLVEPKTEEKDNNFMSSAGLEGTDTDDHDAAQ